MNEKQPENPFIGRHEWNDRYMNMAKAVRNWQLAFLLSMLLALGLFLELIRLNHSSRIQPLAVETCQGVPTKILPVSNKLPHPEALVNYALSQFIINARTIIADTQAQKTLLNKVYAYSADKTIAFLHDYYHENNPFNLSSNYTTQINIINTLAISEHTWQVTWDERTQGLNTGDTTQRYIANLSFRFGKINERFIEDNPFGIYITALSWAQLPIKK